MPTEMRLAQRAFRFALDPTPRQARMFASHAGGARFAYNWGNAQIIAALDARQAEKDAGAEPTVKTPSHFDLCKAWTAWKNEHAADPEPADGERRTNTAWVAENFVGTYQAALRDAAKAWSDFFASRSGKRKGRRLGRPRFKKKGKSRDSFQVHGGTLRMEDAVHVTLPKIGTITVMSDDSLHPAMRRSRARATHLAPRHMGNRRRARTLWRALRRGGGARLIRGTVTRGADGLWWLSLTAEIPLQVRASPSRAQQEGGMIGADFGVREVATFSNGVTIRNSRHLEAALAELRAAQKALSRCQKDSMRREKAKARIGVIHADVARLRETALHRATTVLVRQHDVIAMEGWDVQQVMRGGSKDVPRRIRRDRNRALADTGVGMARQMLSYKGPQMGAIVMVTDPQAKTGRTCSVCRTPRTTALPPHHEMFTSDQCGHVLDRRLNTAQALAGWAAQELSKRGPAPAGPSRPRGGNVRPAADRKVGGGRSPVKRAASTRLGRGEPGTPGG
jgi:putative transposase